MSLQALRLAAASHARVSFNHSFQSWHWHVSSNITGLPTGMAQGRLYCNLPPSHTVASASGPEQAHPIAAAGGESNSHAVNNLPLPLPVT